LIHIHSHDHVALFLSAHPDLNHFIFDRNDFETNQMDVFEFQERNVGKMKRIRIGHDNSGFGAAWHCAKVVVENNNTGESATFEINE
jgi:hypothetical protein